MLKLTAFLFLIFGLSSVHSACDFSHAICSSANLVCPSPSTTITLGTSPYGLIDIDIIVFGSVTLNHGDIQGRPAIRDNFYGQGGISVGDLINDDLAYNVIVGNDLNIVGDAAFYPPSKRIFVGGTASVPAYVGSIDGCTIFNGTSGCLNNYFGSLESYWTQFSDLLNSQTDTATLSISGNTGTLTCSSSSASNYFIHISSSDFNQITSYTTSGCSSTANFIFNIVGNDVRFTGNGYRSDVSFVVYNIVNAPQVTVSTSVFGNIVAPRSNINVLNGDINGVVIAANISNLIQVNVPIYSSGSATPSRAIQQNCPFSGFTTVESSSTSTSGSASGSASNQTVSGTAATTASGSASGTVSGGSATTAGGSATTASDNGGNGGSGVNSGSTPASIIGPSDGSTTSSTFSTSDATSIMMPFALAVVALISLV